MKEHTSEMSWKPRGPGVYLRSYWYDNDAKKQMVTWVEIDPSSDGQVVCILDDGSEFTVKNLDGGSLLEVMMFSPKLSGMSIEPRVSNVIQIRAEKRR